MIWFRWMMAAFVVNGLCTFGLRMLAADGLATAYTPVYLVFWYLSGSVFTLLLALRQRIGPKRADVLIGGGLGACSAAGQTCLGLALGAGIPGSLAYPIALAGGLFLVVLAGVTVFKEKISLLSAVGIGLGVLSIFLLSLEG